MKITMIGRIDECVLLAYSTPAESVRGLVPRGLELVTHRGRAFWNVVLCRVDRMRPTYAPSWCGSTYYHVAYRLYVKARLVDGRTVNGLYFVRSDADSRWIATMGNLATDFRFHAAEIRVDKLPKTQTWEVRSRSGGSAEVSLQDVQTGPRPTLFDSPAEAEAVLRYQPLGLSTDAGAGVLKLAEVFRNETDWQETPVGDVSLRSEFLESLGQGALVLERATRVAPIDYRWQLGRTEPLESPGESPRALEAGNGLSGA